MTNNAYEFEQLLKKSNIEVNFEDTEGGETFCNIYQKLECGPTVRILIVFSKEDDLVSIYSSDYVKVSNPSRKEYIYSLLNDLNIKYTYFKFSMDKESNVSISYFLPFRGNFNCDVIMQILLGMFQIMDSEYPSFMKIMWA